VDEFATPIGPMDTPLEDPAYFAQVRLDPERLSDARRWPTRHPDRRTADGSATTPDRSQGDACPPVNSV